MLLKAILLLISIQSLIAQYAQKNCMQIKIRKDITKFSADELNKWLLATKSFSKTSRFNELSKIHSDNYNQIHDTELFLPWHRKFISVYESELLKLDSSLILPFVDWTTCNTNPHNHPVLQSNMYGGNGNRDNGWCLEDGNFANNTVTTPVPKCVQRRYNKDNNTKLDEFSPKEEVQSRIDMHDRYTDFRASIEGNPHALPHYYIGNGDFDFVKSYSPNDSLFYLHHSYIDMLWYQWQSKNESRFNEYNDDYGKVSVNDELVGLGGVVGDVLDPKNGKLCYKYETWGMSINEALENSPMMESQVTTRSTRNTNIWDRIKAMEFNKTTGEIPNSNFSISRRARKCKLSKPGKISKNMLQMMGMNASKYEENWIMSAKVIQILNANPNYEPVQGC